MRMATSLLLGLLLPTAAFAASWQEELTMQMQELKNCKLGFLAKVVETSKDGVPVVTATAQCEDGRQFDVERIGERGLFKIKECEQKRVC